MKVDDFLTSLEQGASDFWNSFDLNRFIETASRAYVTIRQADQAPTSVARPGTVRTLPDGSQARINADGSMTVITAGGQVQTIGTRGQVTSGAAAATWIPGVPNLVAIGGAAVLAFLAFRALRG
jgi:hypothetical protein